MQPRARAGTVSGFAAAILLGLSVDGRLPAFPHTSAVPYAQTAAAPGAPPSRAPTASQVNEKQLIEDVRALTAPELEGRLTGSPGSRRAQSIILTRFKRLGLRPITASYEQTFSFDDTRRTAPREFDAVNLLGMIAGRSRGDEIVLVAAHYDHLGIRNGRTYHGADDNASGVAAMLAIAAALAKRPPARSVLFAAFDAEEQGLRGSTYFVDNPPLDLKRIRLMINLDMVARGDKNVLHVTGTSFRPTLRPTVEEAAGARRLSVVFGHDRPGILGEDDWTQLSDQAPFHAAGIPFLFFTVENHPDYHRPTDTVDRIPVTFYREATELALETVKRFAEMAVIPG